MHTFQEKLAISDSLSIIPNASVSSGPNLLVLPGLGSFGAGMHEIKKRSFDTLIRQSLDGGARLVGICLGMQLLGKTSEESPGVQGLSLIPAVVEKLTSEIERVPHVGWAASKSKFPQNRFNSLSSNGDFYFVHSFHLRPEDEGNILCKTVFGENEFVSGVISERIIGLQFHPEKSGGKGKALISELIEWARNED